MQKKTKMWFQEKWELIKEIGKYVLKFFLFLLVLLILDVLIEKCTSSCSRIEDSSDYNDTDFVEQEEIEQEIRESR